MSFRYPVDADLGLGSITNRTVGRMTFALSIKAPDNRSHLVRDGIRFLASQLPFAHHIVVEHTVMKERP